MSCTSYLFSNILNTKSFTRTCQLLLNLISSNITLTVLHFQIVLDFIPACSAIFGV